MARHIRPPSLQAAAGPLLAAALLCACPAGCGDPSPSGEGGPSAAAEPATPTPPPETPEQRPSAPTAAQDETRIRTDAQGRKWIGNVPLDVWFDDPLGVAANSSEVAASPPAASTPPASTPSPESPPTAPTREPDHPDASGTAWESLISAAVIDAELKAIRNDLTQALQSLGRYNGNYQEIQSDGATLAALAIIARQHPEPINWKEQSRYVRHLGTQLNEEADALGRAAFDATENAYLQLLAVLDGNVPPDLPADLPQTVPPGEAADRYGVMRRMDGAFQYLRKNINTEQILQAEKNKALHEAAMLTALAAVVSDHSYTSADEQEYATAAKGLIESSLQMQRSVQADDFDGFSTALSAAEKRCNQCHQGYRFADDF